MTVVQPLLSLKTGSQSRALITRGLIMMIAGLVLSGCVASNRLGGGLLSSSPEAGAPQKTADDATPSTSEPIASTELPPPGEAPQNPAAAPAGGAIPLGAGTPKIALLLPLSAPGSSGTAALALKNSAEMAMADLSGAQIELIVKDEKGTPDGAREATKQALAEGARVIIGPLLATSVQSTSSIARENGRPVIAFSTDIGVAGRGVYLLSFLPQTDVDRILSYAASKGKKSLAALIPDTPYGNAVNATLQNVAARNGITIKAIERYAPGAMDAAAQRVGTIKDQIDALFIPENGDGAASTAKALTNAGLDPKKIQYLGTSAWDDARIFALPIFTNGWYPMPDKSGFGDFAAKYKNRYGEDPVRIATLSYDMIFFLNALKQSKGDQAFDSASLTTPGGAIGVDGLFRLQADGTNQRGLVIMQVSKGSSTKIDNAPTSF